MTAAAARTAQPFDFRSDFGAQETAPESIRLTAEEVFALIAKVRSDTLAEASRQEARETLDRLEAVAGALRSVLGDMVQLMGQIEAAGYDAATEARLRETLTMTARKLIDGQGELFGAAGSVSARLDKTPARGSGFIA